MLQELSQKEETLTKMERGLEAYKGKFAVCRHQTGLLYRQFQEEREAWLEEKAQLGKKMADIEGAMAEDKLKVQEFDVSVDRRLF